MICLHVESPYRPSGGFADAAYFLFEKQGKLPGQDAFTIVRTPDEVRGQLIRDVFGVLCFHTRQCNTCSIPCEVPVGAALPLLES